MWPHRRQPTRLPGPGASPGKNTGVGCHFLLQCLKVKSESEFAQSCLTLSDPRDCRLQAPQSMGFSRQEYWSGVQLPSPKIQYSQINKYFSKRITLRYVRRHCELTSGSTQSLFNSSITFFEFFLLPALHYFESEHFVFPEWSPTQTPESTCFLQNLAHKLKQKILTWYPHIALILGSEYWSRQAAPVTRREAARSLDMGLWSCDLMTPHNWNYLFTCIYDVRQAWRTEIICENLYGSVANDKRTIKGLYRSSPKGLLKCLRKVLVPLVPGDRQGLTRNL